jgi:acetyltransferase-like isoleucine patch superfamily enzyme
MNKLLDKLGYIYSRILKKSRGIAKSNSNIHKSSKIETGCTIIDTSMKKNSFCGYDCTINNCEVGAFTSIASRVVIGGSMHPMEFVSMSPVFLSHTDSVKAKYSYHDFKYIPKTIIGNDVWIGEGVFIKSGVRVGNGAVIGMGSIVTKDVPDYAIYAGNPAKQIKMRFDTDTIKALLEIEWWSFSDDRLRYFAPHFTSPSDFIKEFREQL